MSPIYDATYVELVAGLLRITGDSLFQRWFTRHLPPRASGCVDPSIRGKTCIVTGPTSGIGLETAKELALAGAHVVLACRDLRKGKKLAETWALESGQELNTDVQLLDLSSLTGVRQFVGERNVNGQPVHVLINNAGVFNMGGPRRETKDGFEEHWAVNYLGSALLTLLMLPHLARAGSSRVIMVSSMMQDVGSINLDDPNLAGQSAYGSMKAYSQSKLAQTIFTNALQRKLNESLGIDCIAVHPGMVLTEVARSLPTFIQEAQRRLLSKLLLTPNQGARCSLFAATMEQPIKQAKAVRSQQHVSGPFYLSNLELSEVPRLARDRTLSEELWTSTLAQLELDQDIVQRAASVKGVTLRYGD